MKKHSLLPDIQMSGCKFLCHLCEMQKIDELLVMQGAGDVALCALREHRKNASVQSEALRLLKHITVAIADKENEGKGIVQCIVHIMDPLMHRILQILNE